MPHRLPLPRPLVVLPALLVLAGPVRAAPPSPEQLAAWVRDLGSDDFAARENASRRLWEAGRDAEAALAPAARSPDPEVSRRARDILDRFRWGLYPDTPPRIAALITQYQAGPAPARNVNVRNFFALGPAGCEALARIAGAESDPQARRHLLQQITQDASHAAGLLLADGHLDALGPLLELAAGERDIEGAAAVFAAFVYLQGRLPEAVARYAGRPPRELTPAQWEILVHLYRVQGDSAAALTAARKADRPALVDALLYEAGDWKALADRPVRARSGEEVDSLGLRAAFCRLAGHTDRFESLVRQVAEKSRNSDEGEDRLWRGVTALFLNGRPELALEVLRGPPDKAEKAWTLDYAPQAFEVLCARHDFATAFALADAHPEDSPHRLMLDVLHGQVLQQLGHKDKARELFEKVARAKPQGAASEAQEKLVEVEVKLGLHRQAREHAAQILAARPQPLGEPAADLLEKLFPKRAATAAAWWPFLVTRHPGAAPAALLERVAEVMEDRLPPGARGELLRDASLAAAGPPAQRSALLHAVAEAADRAGQLDAAQELLEKTAALDPGAEVLLRLGDLLALQRQDRAAAERYAQAWTRDPGQALPLYLRAECLARLGDAAGARRARAEARKLSLAGETERLQLAEELQRRGLAEPARQERELAARLGAPGWTTDGEAVRHAAYDAYLAGDFARAAALRERAMLSCLEPGVEFEEAGSVVAVPHFIALCRARAHAAAGRFDEARAECDRAEALLPGSVDLPVALVPALDKKGRRDDAEYLFGRAARTYEALCREYPDSGWAHNSYAWLAAACRRHLDVALVHARRAVELGPDQPSYLDTLGEVHFQRGKRDLALAAARRALALRPDSTYFRKQLQRIEAGDRMADLPEPSEEGE